MVTPRHLNSAPITEALIDIRAKLPADIDLSKLSSAHDLLANEYPKKRERRVWEARFEVKDGKPSHTGEDKGVDGYLYVSSDDKQVAQVRLDGFTFSRLRPYETWERLQAETRRLWQVYLDVALPESVTRVALRYINRIELPLPMKDFSDYLTAPPVVPENLPQAVSSFLTRVIVHEQSIGAAATITQALEPRVDRDICSIILDIDVFKESLFASDDKAVWETLDKLHDFKNLIFFESITDRTVELCQ